MTRLVAVRDSGCDRLSSTPKHIHNNHSKSKGCADYFKSAGEWKGSGHTGPLHYHYITQILQYILFEAILLLSREMRKKGAQLRAPLISTLCGENIVSHRYTISNADHPHCVGKMSLTKPAVNEGRVRTRKILDLKIQAIIV